MKKPPRQIRLDPDILEEVQKIAEITELSQVEIIRQMVAAGVRAIKGNGYKLHLPLRLTVAEVDEGKKSSGDRYPLKADPGLALNEEKTPKKKAGS